jgi:amidase
MSLALLLGCGPSEPTVDIISQSPETLAQDLAAGELSAVEVTGAFLARIEALDRRGPSLHAVLELNDAALDDAAALDEILARSGPVGPLHGLPVLIKGNIDVAGLVNSAGSLALADNRIDKDASLVAAARRAGAVILGTANLSEWANFRDANSSSGWSSLGGQTKNPHVLDRNPCGSSSGSAVAVAAGLVPLAVGTETNGSIVCPAGTNGVVGIKPTVGLVSRTGVIPISHSQDTAGPIARTVTGAALLLQALAGHDPADSLSKDVGALSLTPDPAATDLAGRRIGILRTYRGAGRRPRVETIYQDAVDRLQVLGAELIDPIEYESTPAMRGASYRILLREFKAGLNAYLAGRGLPAMASLEDLIEFDQTHADRVMPIFGQSIFVEAATASGLDDPEHAGDVELAQAGLRADLMRLFSEHRLDALFIPVNGPAWKTDWTNGDYSNFGGTAYLAAVTGYPSIVLPAGRVDHLPIAVGFVGRPDSEADLIQMAYALEQSLPPLPEPEFLPTLETL